MTELVRQFITKQPCSARTVRASLWKVTAERQPSMLVQNRSLTLLAWTGLKKIHRKKLTKVWESPSTQRLKEKRKGIKVHNTLTEDWLSRWHFTLCRQRKRFWPNSWSVGLGIFSLISYSKPRASDLLADRILIFASHSVGLFLPSLGNWCLDVFLLIETAQGIGLSSAPNFNQPLLWYRPNLHWFLSQEISPSKTKTATESEADLSSVTPELR